MIVPGKKVIYIKIPKTASTTVAREIWKHYGVRRQTPSEEVINLNFEDHEKIGPHGWHVAYSRIEAELGEEIDRYKAFSVIREPLDRTLSVYRWAHQKNPSHPLLQSFDVFLKAVERNDPNLSQQALIHSRPQVAWLQNNAGVIDDRLEIFPLGQLERCADFLSEALGFYPEFGRHNVSDKQPITITESSRTLVETLYKNDFELYRRFA